MVSIMASLCNPVSDVATIQSSWEVLLENTTFWRKAETTTRSPSSALLSRFLGEGSPSKIDKTEKMGALFLTSLLEDLDEVPESSNCPERELTIYCWAISQLPGNLEVSGRCSLFGTLVKKP